MRRLLKNSAGLLILIGLSMFMVNNLPDDKGPGGWIVGLPYNMLLNSLVFFMSAGKVFRFSPAYYRMRSFEADGKLYRRLGAEAARKIFRVIGFVKFDGKPGSLEALHDGMLFAEKNHLVALVVNVAVMIYAGLLGVWSVAGSLLLFNLLLNGYPIMVQRYNRPRVERLLAGRP